MKKTAVLIAIVFFCFVGKTQSNHGKISIRIENDEHNPLESATVELLKSKDSSLVKVAITDKNGQSTFENIRFGNYLLRSSLVNYTTSYSSAFELSEARPTVVFPAMVLLLAEKQMNNVTVVTRKPFIQKLNDRLVVNVESSPINAGSSAMDILERSPGITIDQNDVISMRGKQGVIIMIDGKLSPLSGQDLANYLRGLPSTAIERIDLITNPSAKYDAAGNAGIIDIRMKKDQRFGANGTLTAGYGQGIYPKTNTGTTFNYRDKKINIFGNYNYAYREGLNHLILDRNFYNNGVFDGEDKKDNYTTFPQNVHVARLGMDFFPDKKTIIGFVANSTFIHYKSNNDNNSVVIDNADQPSYTFKTQSNGTSGLTNSFGNINLKHSFDTTGKELTADIDYGVFKSNSLSSNNTNYYNLDGSTLKPFYLLNGTQNGKLILQTNKADYVNPLPNGAKFETGFKTSYVSSDNDQHFFDASTGVPVDDTTKTNHFIYKEYNYAGYVNFSKEFKKLNVQIGLRGEETQVRTKQVKSNLLFDTSYFQLFPSAFFNYKINDNKTLGISVSRRIDRPNYSDLNPFLFLIDVSTYSSGNTGLKPQLTWSYEMDYTVKDLNFSLNYSHTRDVQNIAIAKFKDVFPNIHLADSNVTVEIPVNLTSSDYAGLTISAP
ncbi:MAG TPA: outer membrane beta-barrel protein, partial [Chitinophagaceae bacterium]